MHLRHYMEMGRDRGRKYSRINARAVSSQATKYEEEEKPASRGKHIAASASATGTHYRQRLTADIIFLHYRASARAATKGDLILPS